jgi:hypothetical protein
MGDLKCALIIPDTHRKWHHVKAYNLMLEVAKHVGVDEVVILGDYADFYFASGHGPKHPKLLNTTVEEVASVNEGLDELDKLFPDAKKKYIEGNHENRLTRFCQNKCPELFGYVDAKHLFKIHERPGWTWINYGPNQRTQVLGSKLYARHEPFGTSAKATAARALCSVVYGHIHRIESSFVVGLDGSEHIAFSVGWLGDKRKDEIFGYVKGHAQWQLGFGLVYASAQTGMFYPQPIHIIDRGGRVSCVVSGKRFVA